MAGALSASPTYSLQPSQKQVLLETNYISNFDFMSQYLPDIYEKEFERFGNRSISSFLRMVSAELPTNSDLIKWTEQGRLHTKYISVGTAASQNADTATFQVNDTIGGNIALRAGQTIVVIQNDGSGVNRALITAVDLGNSTFDVAFYEADGLVTAGTGAGNADVTIFIYGSEFRKGTTGMEGSLEAEYEAFETSPIIMKDKFQINGSDMAQIGWIEVTSENGASGYLWYIKSEAENRLRYDDYLETSMIEARPAETNSGVAANTGNIFGNKGTEGVFYAIENRGNLWGGGNPSTVADFDTIVGRLDKQGAIEENVIFLDREFGFDIDNMLSMLPNGAPTSGTNVSFGLFNNDVNMALNLGFTGFRRGYDFYKSDWKYLNDPTMRGDLPTDAGSGRINGLLAPAGTKTVYDQVLGKNAKRPFLHVRYRASETENRKYKTWVTGSAGGATTSDLDAMEVHFLTERCICTLGANNFFMFEA